MGHSKFSEMKSIKSGTKNWGYDYENLVPAFIALQLLQDPNTTFFSFKLNPSPYGKFDDLIIQINEDELYALQLKHRETGKDKLKTDEFHKSKKNFNIKDYHDSYFKDDEKTRRSHKYILFTNVKFEELGKDPTYIISEETSSLNDRIGGTGKIYQFKTLGDSLNLDPFFQNFFLFSEQMNVSSLEKYIITFFKDKFHSSENVAILYIHFFKSLRDNVYGCSEVTRDAVILKLMHLTLQDAIIKIPMDDQRSQKLEMVEKIIKDFDVTVMEGVSKETVQKCWQYISKEANQEQLDKMLSYKIITEESKKLKNVEPMVVAYCLEEAPIFLHLTKIIEPTVYEILRLCKTLTDIKLKFVLVDASVDETQFNNCNIFKNLSDLKNDKGLKEETLKFFRLSLQGRSPLSIFDMKFEFDTHLEEFISASDVLNSLATELDTNLSIGKEMDPLPEPYFKRKLIRSKFSWKELQEIHKKKITVVFCDGEAKSFEKFLKDRNMGFRVITEETFISTPEQYKKSAIVLTDNESTNLKDCYQLDLKSENASYMLEWKEKCIDPCSTELFNNQINAVCDSSGTGKTTMMRYMAKNYPLDHWVVTIALKEIEDQLFQQNTDYIIDYFLDRKSWSCTSYFKEKKRIVFFIDGLDELQKDSLDKVINLIKQLIKDEYKVWLFCTDGMKSILLNNLGIISICTVDEVTKDDQKEYIRSKLLDAKMEGNYIDEIVTKIFEIDEKLYADLLKFPLYLYMITDILCKEKQSNHKDTDLENALTLTKMYSQFMDENFKHYFDKSSYKKNNDIDRTITNVFKYVYIKEYQIAALRSSLDRDIFNSLQIKNDKKFLVLMKEKWDVFGLIDKVNEDGKVVFTHNSFAHYFAAMWLVENFVDIPYEKRNFIFQPQYASIKYFFDTKLAEGHPLHLAVINNDLSKVESLAQEHFQEVDHGDRTALHLASAKGCYYPLLKKDHAHLEVKKVLRDRCNSEDNILKHLIKLNQNLTQKDKLFGWNCFQYADAAFSLHLLEILSNEQSLRWDFLNNYQDIVTLCYYSVTFGFIKILEMVIQKIGLQDCEKDLHKPLLHLAIENKQTDIAKYLIELGVNLNKNSGGMTPLHEAASWGLPEVVKLLPCSPDNLEARDTLGRTPLQFAAKWGHLEVVELLFDKGADFNTIDDEYKRTPLHKAAYMGQIEVIKFLLKKRIDINTLDGDSKSALQRAADMGHFDTVKCLVKNGINISEIDKRRRTALHYAAFEGYTEIVKFLVENKITVLIKDENGKTARDIAASRGHEAIANILEDAEEAEIKRGSLGPSKQYKLHEAVMKNDLEELKTLLKTGNIEETNDRGDTILHVAADEGHQEIVEHLLKEGARTDVENNFGRVPLYQAATRGHVNIVKMLLGRGQDTHCDKWGLSPLQRSANSGNPEVVEAFLNVRIDINLQSKEGGTPLHSALRGGHINLIDWLFSKGADIGIKTKRGKTCLHVAAQRGVIKSVERLIQEDKRIIDEVDARGRTALHWAAEKGYKVVVECLVNAGANTNIADSSNRTPIEVASATPGREEIVKYLQN